MSNDRHALCAALVLSGPKHSPNSGLRAKHIEEVVGHINRSHALRLAAGFCEIDLRIPPSGNAIEELFLLAPITERDRRSLAALKSARSIALPYRNQLV